MAFPKKASVKVAAPSQSYRHNYDFTHIFTTDYFKRCVNLQLVVPSDNKFTMQNKSFCRYMAMKRPAFISAKVVQRCYFVPFKLVQKSYNDMIEGKPHAYDGSNTVFQIPNYFRYASSNDIVNYFIQSAQSSITTNSSYDFETQENGAWVQRNFTTKGRAVYNILIQLGIKINLVVDSTDSRDDYPVNIMNLLAYLKVIVDYDASQVYESISRNQVESIINSNSYGLENLTAGEITTLLDYVSSNIYYDNDYFTSAWDHPTGPNMLNTYESIQLTDITQPNAASTSKSTVYFNNHQHVGSEGTPVVKGDDNSPRVSGFSQYIDDALKRLTDYVTRNRLVGNRIVDRFLARFGIKLNDEELNRVAFVGDYSYNINFGDVMSNADTSGAALGDFAGKGIGYGESEKMEYYNKESGVYIGITYIVPKIGYFEGTDRFSQCINRFDFWTPEFDNLGVDAVSQEELFIPNRRYNNIKYNPHNKVFGYQPRYTWMKKKLDTVSGEFIFESTNAGLDAWHMMREINPYDYVIGNDINIQHSQGFCLANDNIQYRRNFNQNKADNIYCINGFKIECYNKMLPIYDTYDFDSKGKEILMNVGGKINSI